MMVEHGHTGGQADAHRRDDYNGVHRCVRIGRLAALLVVIIGLTVLIGWAMHIEILKRLAPGFVAMNPATTAAMQSSSWPS